tara:strand:+ start:19378 stop:19608 length:231 start_codon:yes stop_codon:yes gene_type:complete
MTTTRISTHVRFADEDARGVEVRIRKDYAVLEITAGDSEHTYYFETLQEVKDLLNQNNWNITDYREDDSEVSNNDD